MQNSSLYELRKVEQWYNGRCVLNIDQLAVHSGEILAIVGPSGAGKSTLLRLLNFLEPPTEGKITFDGQTATAELSLSQHRRVTTVFQQPLLLKRSVLANLSYGLALRGKKLTEEKAAYWLERLGLTTLATQPARKLSAGEAQRVALVRALLIRPDVLLLDEPTANLDPYNVGLIETIIREDNSENQTTTVLVTHNIFQARRLAHRTALLIEGKIVEIAETETFFTDPKNPKTAAFLKGEIIY
ncbi:MAG: ATP-binding cassette domain-containing protein [Candidatus Promineifilaceae bacterium]